MYEFKQAGDGTWTVKYQGNKRGDRKITLCRGVDKEQAKKAIRDHGDKLAESA